MPVAALSSEMAPAASVLPSALSAIENPNWSPSMSSPTTLASGIRRLEIRVLRPRVAGCA